MCYSSKLLYEYEATISNKIFSDALLRRFSDKPEFFEIFCISIIRELWLFVVFYGIARFSSCMSFMAVCPVNNSSGQKLMLYRYFTGVL
jgi:uncharacterized RDD family membrane protein YckC